MHDVLAEHHGKELVVGDLLNQRCDDVSGLLIIKKKMLYNYLWGILVFFILFINYLLTQIRSEKVRPSDMNKNIEKKPIFFSGFITWMILPFTRQIFPLNLVFFNLEDGLVVPLGVDLAELGGDPVCSLTKRVCTIARTVCSFTLNNSFFFLYFFNKIGWRPRSKLKHFSIVI